MNLTPSFFDNSDIRRQDLAWNDWSAVSAFLADQLVCRFAVHDTPFPYVVGQSFRFVDGVFLVHCSRYGKLSDLIQKNPNVAIEVDQTVSLLKAPKGQNTSFEYYSVFARCEVESFSDIESIRAQQNDVLQKYRPEGRYKPIDDFAASQIVAFRCVVIGMSAKKRILADGQFSPPGQPAAPYVRFAFPASASLSSLPKDAFDSRQIGLA
jgi:nitroimidazol reductase NimA-like FMN-containing flavoprotein (pyridoxamine 5'-phosphate oxidase superfamily)